MTRGDRTEDLLARDAGGVVDVVEDRRLDEVAAVERAAGGAAAADATFASRLPIS